MLDWKMLEVGKKMLEGEKKMLVEEVNAGLEDGSVVRKAF
jgi:hypothetical protein